MSTPENQSIPRVGPEGSALVLRPYAPGDADAVVALWNSSDILGRLFPLDETLWRQNVDSCPATAWHASFVAVDAALAGRIVGAVAVKLPRHISAIVVHPSYQRRGVGTALVKASMAAVDTGERAGTGEKSGAWVAGAELNHFFPGVPAEATVALEFFRSLGFSVGDAARTSYDLMRDMSGFAVPDAVLERIERLRGAGIEFGPCRVEDVAALRRFLEQTFPGRWTEDTMRRIAMEPDPLEIIIARETQSGEVLGFAHTFSNRSRWIGPPIYWRALLGARYGGLGPIGVADRARKIGLGLALLAVGVQAVAETGAEKMAIDWTNLLEFYGKLGFAPWKRYLPVWRA